MPMDEVRQLVWRRLLGQDGRGRELREAAGISLRELARLLDVDVATLSRWERGEVQPRSSGAIRWVLVCQELQRLLAEPPP